MSVRLLVTGSRKWDHLPSIGSTLEHFTHAAFQLGSRLTVVHGAAVSGADAIAASWASTRNRNGWPVDVELAIGVIRRWWMPGLRCALRSGAVGRLARVTVSVLPTKRRCRFSKSAGMNMS